MITTPEALDARWLKGLMEACILGVIRSGAAYGYEIAGRFEAAGFPRPKGGSLYPILARLESDGLLEAVWVEGQGGPGRKYYRLTPVGEAEAAATAEGWASFSRRVATLIDQPSPGEAVAAGSTMEGTS